MKIELKGGFLVIDPSESPSYYQLGWDIEPLKNHIIKIYIKPDLNYKNKVGLTQMSFKADGHLGYLGDGSFFIDDFWTGMFPMYGTLVSGNLGKERGYFSPNVRLDPSYSTGEVIAEVKNMVKEHPLIEYRYLAYLQEGQYLASKLFPDRDPKTGGLSFYKRMVVNINGEIKRLPKVSLEEAKKISSGDFSDLLKPPVPLWRKIFSSRYK